ncbi:hypothetical protein ESA_03883 [Cronobacter sakazakii ATCC BAA-894]|uniref:Uncharacterized protein n=1 Tax=Cronobacter sakazakii (strain ATCC BAA-894) TaxID=290339 RepID=A7MNF0_CROS8|nr:hypothetical protein ESA_03883 [Cronobacter sakazakii ATCC BAA-894]
MRGAQFTLVRTGFDKPARSGFNRCDTQPGKVNHEAAVLSSFSDAAAGGVLR